MLNCVCEALVLFQEPADAGLRFLRYSSYLESRNPDREETRARKINWAAGAGAKVSMSQVRKKWSPAEDRVLSQKVLQAGEIGPRDWSSIAMHLPGRTNKDCRKRWCNHLVVGINKGAWVTKEDEKLFAAVQEHGPQWPLVAELVGTRSADQCAKRWVQALDPALDRSKWLPKEERTLLQAVLEHGRQWKYIQEKYFPDRATNNVKNRYMSLTRRESLEIDQLLKQGAWCNGRDSKTCTNSPESVPDSPEDRILAENVPTSLDIVTQSTTASTLDDLDFIPNAGGMELDGCDHANFLPGDNLDPQGSMSFQDLDNNISNSGDGIASVEPFLTSGFNFRGVDNIDMLLGQQPSSPKFVVSIDDPSSELVRNIVGVLIESRANFKSEMSYDGKSM